MLFNFIRNLFRNIKSMVRFQTDILGGVARFMVGSIIYKFLITFVFLYFFNCSEITELSSRLRPMILLLRNLIALSNKNITASLQTKLTKIRNEPKRPETSRNNPQNCETIRKDSNFKLGEIWNFLLASIFVISSPNAQIWAFLAKEY